jgi:hypothetical protein
MTTPPSFPALAGLGWSSHKKPTFATIVASHVSGREVRDALYQNPIWQFELTFDGLVSDSTSFPNLGAQSLQSLMGLFLQCQGRFGTFLYTDPTDDSAVAQSISHPAGRSRPRTASCSRRRRGPASSSAHRSPTPSNVALTLTTSTSSSSWRTSGPRKASNSDRCARREAGDNRRAPWGRRARHLDRRLGQSLRRQAAGLSKPSGILSSAEEIAGWLETLDRTS